MNTPYRSSYRFTSTLISAIVQRNHYYLVTGSDDPNVTLLKIYADKDLSIEVAVFKLSKSNQPWIQQHRIGKGNWILIRQSKATVKTTVSYEQEEGT